MKYRQQEKFLIDVNSQDRFVRSFILNDEGKQIKTILIVATYQYIYFNFGDNNTKIQEWMNLQSELIFNEFKLKPDDFKEQEIKKYFQM
ncbi:MAG: hypothetical protein NT068_00975 [Candidatus Nomurabacteria bacterium]|nr:hypothetical protein [Candidatus Nomurabacteria bacterium]